MLKAIYFPNSSFLDAQKRRGASWIWASILHGRDLIKRGGKWCVRDGNSIRINSDNWLPSRAIQQHRTIDLDSRVSSLIDQLAHN